MPSRTNSLQSLRLRCLESEVSRLLAENLELREEILILRNKVEESQPEPSLFDSVRQKLEDKMMELTGLIAELQAPPRKRRSIRREPTQKPERHEPDEEMEGRLPAIREDKQWPRLSIKFVEALDLEDNVLTHRCSMTEIQSTDQEAMMESPDPGSPPVAQFRDEDMDSNPPQFLSTASPDEEEKEPEPLSQELSLNIETRRRRRDSGKMNPKRVMIFNSSPDDEIESDPVKKSSDDETSLRTSRKRKLGDRLNERDEENSWFTKNQEGFPFSVKASTNPELKANVKLDLKPTKTSKTEKIESIEIIPRDPSERKALSNSMFPHWNSDAVTNSYAEPVNTDPIVSPKKPSRALLLEKPSKGPVQIIGGKDAAKERIRDRKAGREEIKAIISSKRTTASKQSAITKPPPAVEPVPVEKLISLPPKTPGALDDIFSPISESQSADRPAGKDTPPPGDLTSMGSTETMGRTARRSRPAVNYAEPSLNAKMRRPTKELLDAVGKDGRPLQGAVTSKKGIEKPTSQWKPAYSASMLNTISKEDPPSPLTNKTSPLLLEKKSIADAIKDTILSDNEDVPIVKNRRASRASSAAHHQSMDRSTSTSLAQESTRQREQEPPQPDLAIFDFTDSSPSETKIVDIISKSSMSRRHSTMSGDKVKEIKEVRERKPTCKVAIGRRKSMMV